MIRGLKINTINREIAFFYLVLATIFALQSCAAKSLDLADAGRVNVESIPSKAGHVERVSILASDMGIKITGEVHGSFHQRSNVYGHLDVEVISPNGDMLWKETFNYRNRGGQSRTSPFSVEVPVVIPDGSTIRVIHHASLISETH